MPFFSVVLDSCVLVPAPLRDTLLRAAEKGLFRPRWSEDILREVQRVLVREGMATEAQSAYLIATLEDIFDEAKVHGYQDLVQVMLNHADDRHVLAAAVASDTEAIVTKNVRHYPPDSVEPYAIEVLTPDEFLIGLHDRNPGVLRRTLREQGEDLSPPRPPQEICEKLRLQAPGFVEVILPELDDDPFHPVASR